METGNKQNITITHRGDGFYCVECGGRFVPNLCKDEALYVVASLLIREDHQWMMTYEQWIECEIYKGFQPIVAPVALLEHRN